MAGASLLCTVDGHTTRDGILYADDAPAQGPTSVAEVLVAPFGRPV